MNGVPEATAARAATRAVILSGGADADRALRRRARRRAARRPRGASCSRRRSSGRASAGARSRTSSSAARTRPARTTATSRAWPCCSPGCPSRSPGVTVNRLCASGLSAVVEACRAIMAGDGDLFVAGGVESMTRAPLAMAEGATRRGRAATPSCTTRTSAGASPTRGWRRCSRSSRWARRARTSPSAGASRARTRTRSRSGRSSAGLAAHAAGRFADELVPVGEVGASTSTRAPRRRSRSSAPLRPAFRAGGTVTAGNASGVNDGAAALVIASEEKARGARASSRSARSSAAPRPASTRA